MKITNNMKDSHLLLNLRHAGQVVTFPDGVYGLPGPVIVCDNPDYRAVTGALPGGGKSTFTYRLVCDPCTGSTCWLPGHFVTALVDAEMNIGGPTLWPLVRCTDEYLNEGEPRISGNAQAWYRSALFWKNKYRGRQNP